MKKIRMYRSVFFYLTVLSFIIFVGCKKNEEREFLKGGEAIVRVNLKGISFEPEKPKVNAFSAHKENSKISIPINDKYAIEATLTAEGSAVKQASAKTMLATEVRENLPSGIKYRLVVYETNGNFVSQKVYTTGSQTSDDGTDLKLDGGKTYKFVFYSFNSSETPMEANPNKKLEEATLDEISGKDVLYQVIEKGISGETTNYLDVVMKHIYSRIDVTIDSGELGNISAIEAVFSPHRVKNNIKLLNGSITYDSKEGKVPLNFNGLNTKNLTSSIIVSSPQVSNASLTLSSIKIGTTTLKNKLINGLTITPGVKYNLNLTVKDNVIRKKRVLTIGGSWYVPVAGNGLEQTKLLTSTANFGPTGTVKSDGFEIINVNTKGNLTKDIENYKPDIIILAYPFTLSYNSDADAIFQFLKDGGKAILCMQTDQRPERILRLVDVLKSQSNIPYLKSYTNYVKLLSNIDHPITNGPFGDIRGKFIGDDVDDTNYITPDLLDKTKIDILSENNDGVIGFVHKQYKLLYWTDGGTLAGLDRGSKTISPLLVDAEGRPLNKPYYNGAEVSNSFLLANALAWFLRD
ncbi:fimbrillin family protein [Olivibacter sp. CPCC 100613]|uniref:fimbrillin family protein n=1 Tax=Olivibacter sp. CPCC 100613 TaxID=3079931 RepID=UPI002FF9B102